MNDDLSQIVTTKEDHTFGMMTTKHFWHVSSHNFDVRIALAGFLTGSLAIRMHKLVVASLCSEELTDVDLDFVRVLSPPGTMYQYYGYERKDIRIKLFPIWMLLGNIQYMAKAMALSVVQHVHNPVHIK